MAKLINILLERNGVLFRFGRVVFSDEGDIYYNFGTKYHFKVNHHDSYHATNEVHQGRQRGDAGNVFQFKPPEQITAPIQFGSTTGSFDQFREYRGPVTRRDVVLPNPPHVTHPMVGVYLEPARTLMVRRTYGYITPFEGSETLSIQTRRLTPILDMTVVHAWVHGVTMGGLIGFDPRMTSKDVRKYFKGTVWTPIPADQMRVSVEVHNRPLQDMPKPN